MTKGRKKTTRPRQPTGQGRKNVLRIRLTAEERATLDVAASAQSLDTATWARFILFEHGQPFENTVEGLTQLLNRGGLQPAVRAWIQEIIKRWPLPEVQDYERIYEREEDETVRNFINRYILAPYDEGTLAQKTTD